MRVLYVCADPGIPLYGRKGCSTHVRETCYVLRELGHEIKVLCSNIEGDKRDTPELDVEVVPPLTSRKLGFDLRRALLDRRIWKRLQQVVAEWKPDVIYERYSLYSAAGTQAERRYGLPRLVELNAFLTHEQRDRIRLGWLARRVENAIIRRARRVIVVSEPLRREVAQLGVPLESIIKMPMAVNLDRFNPAADGSSVRAEFGLQDRFVIGYVGTLSGWHGLRLLFPVARALRAAGAPPFAFLIVGGDGEKLAASRELCRQEGVEDLMYFIGSVPHEIVPRYVAAMDAAVIPDTTYWSSPSKLFEYMASGVPILAPRYPAIEEAMSDRGEGRLFDVNDTEGMTQCALEMIRDPEECRRMGRSARARAERERSWLRNGREILELYRGLGARIEPAAPPHTKMKLKEGSLPS